MRMWMVDPAVMCKQHLLGEHVELHMFVGTIRRGVRLSGYVSNGLVDTGAIENRHNALVKEMKRRGMNHAPPLRYEDRLSVGVVDEEHSLNELAHRCKACRELQVVQEVFG